MAGEETSEYADDVMIFQAVDSEGSPIDVDDWYDVVLPYSDEWVDTIGFSDTMDVLYSVGDVTQVELADILNVEYL